MLHGYIPPHRFLPYLSWTEIADLPDKENTVIVLPTGATEQHGPHMGCGMDTEIADKLCRAVSQAERVPSGGWARLARLAVSPRPCAARSACVTDPSGPRAR
mgnify:CR=1 FL=1